MTGKRLAPFFTKNRVSKVYEILDARHGKITRDFMQYILEWLDRVSSNGEYYFMKIANVKTAKLKTEFHVETPISHSSMLNGQVGR